MTVPPEIKRLRNEAAATVVALSLAEQAVRDVEARVSRQLLECEEALCAAEAEHAEWIDRMSKPLRGDTGHSMYSLSWDDLLAVAVRNVNAALDARREAFREAVEALRETTDPWACGAADFLERQFLTSEGEDDADS